jgi:thiol-disulfide isomerase/thioredoxin
MKSHRAVLTIAALIVCAGVALSGCGRSSSIEVDGSPSPQFLKEITLAEIDATGLAAAIGRHRGKVVLVDFWATWCDPCVTLFPHTVALRNRYSRGDLAVVTVSMNKREAHESVLEFLRRQRANTENYLNSIESDAEAFDAFNIGDGIPQIRIYDRSGKMLRTISGNRPEEIDQAVAEALSFHSA